MRNDSSPFLDSIHLSGVRRDMVHTPPLLRKPLHRALAFSSLFLMLLMTGLNTEGLAADDFPLTRNVPIPEFQNRTHDIHQYDFDAPPEGMFRSIVLSESFEEEMGFQRTHEIVPVKPTGVFQAGSEPVFIVFKLHQHYQSFQLFGLCYPEEVPGLDTAMLVSQDAMYVALEDDTGYLKLLAPQTGWQPGRYKVLIHAGEQVNDMTLMGTMRFTIAQPQNGSASTTVSPP